MPVLQDVMYVGILRLADTQETAIRENIQKARRTIYSLMGSGLHGHNGVDPETSIHLNIYVLPMLVYGLEVALLKATLIDKLETKKVREKSREFHNHKPQPFPDTKRKRKPTKPNKHKSNKRTKSTKISYLFPKRGNRNARRT